MNEILNQAIGMLAGVAVGDALGMPSEFLTRETIRDWYGKINGLLAANEKHPHRKLPFGSVTDDTDHTLIIAKIIIEQGGITSKSFADELYAWSQTKRVQDNRFVGPSTLKTLAALKENVPLDEAPRGGTSVGAAMRVAPIAIAFPNRAEIIEQVVSSCSVSHFTHGAISGAMAMAFALSEALDPNADVQSVAEAAQEGAAVGRNYGDWNWSIPIERRIDYVLDWVKLHPQEIVLDLLADLIGVDLYPEQLVPGAIGLMLLADGKPMPAMLMAANLGGDTDTLASMVGSICGGLSGVEGFDPVVVEKIEIVNQIDLQKISKKLVEIRINQKDK